jgi:CRP-like cAMP-binding protein
MSLEALIWSPLWQLNIITLAGISVLRVGYDGKDGGRLAPGDCFGETGLFVGMNECCTLKALTRFAACKFDQQAFAPLLANRPNMADDLAQDLSRRPLPTRTAQQQCLQYERCAHVRRRAIERVFIDRRVHALEH